MRPVLLLTVAVALAACAREPLDTPCPDVAAGGLVLSEIRGKQAGSTDTLGQWIEVYNASGQSVALGGLSVEMRKIDGSATTKLFVREEMQLAPASYATLGRFERGGEPSYVTYGFGADLDSDLYSAAALELRACDTLVDRAVYRTLPTGGSLGYDGARTPDASGNDTETAWCNDADGTTKPGTPLARNKACAL